MKKIIKFCFALSALLIAKLVPFNVVIGSWHAFFSWTSVAAPVVASQCGLGWIALFALGSKLFSVSLLPFFLLHRLPLLVGSQAFVKQNTLLNIVVPAVCMVLFIVHPVGSQAWFYSLYWLIPMVLCFVKSNVATRSLSASFIMHAVGSVVWLYTGAISPVTWMALIPVVVCERLIIAAALVGTNELCSVAKGYVLNVFAANKIQDKVTR